MDTDFAQTEDEDEDMDEGETPTMQMGGISR